MPDAVPWAISAGGAGVLRDVAGRARPPCIGGCGRLERTRGLCLPCYQRVRRLIVSGDLGGWWEAIEQGLARRSQRPRRPNMEAIARAPP